MDLCLIETKWLQIIQIQGALAVLDIAILFEYQLFKVEYNVPCEKDLNKDGEEPSNSCFVRVSLFIKIKLDRVTKNISIPQPCIHIGLTVLGICLLLTDCLFLL